MMIRTPFLTAAAGLMLALGGCGDRESGPISVSVIGGSLGLVNPNLQPLDPPSALLIEATAQGLVRFDSSGQIEPALAQSWIVSDDGLRYTFRLARSQWADGAAVTAEQVAARLRAAASPASRNPYKPLIMVIAAVEAMTDNVLEISLRAPRPNFLQLLAQPEMAIIRNGFGTGPFAAQANEDGTLRLSMHQAEEETDDHAPDIILRAEPAALAVARFGQQGTALVAGGTLADLPVARAADPPAAALRFDPVRGLLGLVFAEGDGRLADPALRGALSMAVDRAAAVAAFNGPGLQPRASIVPPGIDELPAPAAPAWTATPLAARRAEAARIIASSRGDDEEFVVKVAVPDGFGYRLLFALLKRDWRSIGVTAERVAYTARADLRLIDAVAPANLSSWYLRRFSCESNAVCSTEADRELAAARLASTPAERRQRLAEGDRLLAEAVPFIAISAPVRWSLVAPRLTGFQTNAFGRHFVGGLIGDAQ